MNASNFIDSYFDNRNVCPSCDHYCHESKRHPDLLPYRKEFVAKVARKYGIERINKEFEKLKLPYFVETTVSSYNTKIKPSKLDVIETVSEHERISNRGLIGIKRELLDKTTQMLWKKETVTFVERTESYEEEEPIYKTETAYRNETYQETVYVDKPVTKSRKVETPYQKQINKPMYNTWTHRMEDRWYTEYYTDVSYENYTTTERMAEYVTKERRVPYEKKIQIGTKTVTKYRPIHKTEIRNVSYPVEMFGIKQTTYSLVSKKVTCNNCMCSSCNSLLVRVGNYIASIFSNLSCCSERSHYEPLNN